MNEKPLKRAVNGILLVDKPVGLTSNAVLQRIKHYYCALKAGHTGSLDPLASGLLPICFGKSTKNSQSLLDAPKSYVVTAKLGVRTTTSDAEGEVLTMRPVPALTDSEINKFLNAFRGTITQVPSMYSALKYQGKPLYYYARRGIEVPRVARTLHISRLAMVAYQQDMLSLIVDCSKGTYIRTLIDDLGELMGCGAHVIALRRTAVHTFSVDHAVTLDYIQSLSESDQLEAMDALLLEQ